MKSFNIGDLVRVSLFNLSAEYREIKKSKIGVNKIAIILQSSYFKNYEYISPE